MNIIDKLRVATRALLLTIAILIVLAIVGYVSYSIGVHVWNHWEESIRSLKVLLVILALAVFVLLGGMLGIRLIIFALEPTEDEVITHV